MRKEKWKLIPGWNNYEVSNLGRARNCLTNKVLKCHINKYGYLVLCLSEYGRKRVTCSVHILVLTAWVGERPNKMAGAHLDGVKLNNKLLNLKWVTYEENELHKKDHGTFLVGVQKPASKLTDNKVRQLRADRVKGIPYHILARKYGVSYGNARAAALGLSWSHVR